VARYPVFNNIRAYYGRAGKTQIQKEGGLIMFGRIYAIIKKEFRQTFRDPRMKMMIFVTPFIQVIIFGYAATTDVNRIPTAVYDLDNTQQSRDLIRAFTASKYFHVSRYLYSDSQINDVLNSSAVHAVIHIQHGFAKDLLGNAPGEPAQIQLIVDGTDSNIASVVLGYASSIIQAYSCNLASRQIDVLLEQVGSIPSVDLRNRAWFNPNLLSRNFYIPGVIALIVSLMSLMLTSMSIVREKEIGTIEQLIVSPLTSAELIIGKLIPFAAIAVMEAAFVTVVGVLWFDIPVHGSILLLLFATLVYLLVSLGVGLLISTISATQQQALMSVFLFFFPLNLLSGFIFPIYNMPVLIQCITIINPLRYFIVILRGIFLKGVGITILWPEILILLIMGIFVLTVSSLRFHKSLG
jgi:ABC-2 type transport system permease protein